MMCDDFFFFLGLRFILKWKKNIEEVDDYEEISICEYKWNKKLMVMIIVMLVKCFVGKMWFLV